MRRVPATGMLVNRYRLRGRKRARARAPVFVRDLAIWDRLKQDLARIKAIQVTD